MLTSISIQHHVFRMLKLAFRCADANAGHNIEQAQQRNIVILIGATAIYVYRCVGERHYSETISRIAKAF